MLPKRSTHVDQNLESKSIESQIFITIFRVTRNLLVTRNDSKKPLKEVDERSKSHLVSALRDICNLQFGLEKIRSQLQPAKSFCRELHHAKNFLPSDASRENMLP